MKNRPVRIFCLVGLLALANNGMLRAQTNTNVAVANATNAAAKVSVPVATNANVVLPPKPRPPTRIEAEGPADFDLTGRRMIYRDHVRVDDPEMKLSCEWLAADLPPDGGHVTNIVAETNVVIDFADEKGQPYHATGDKAAYFYHVQGGVTNETITLTGNPAQIEDALGTQTGDEIIFDRVNNRVSIPKNAKMVSRQNLNGAIPGTNSPPVTRPPTDVTNSPPATHRAGADTNFPPGKLGIHSRTPCRSSKLLILNGNNRAPIKRPAARHGKTGEGVSPPPRGGRRFGERGRG